MIRPKYIIVIGVLFFRLFAHGQFLDSENMNQLSAGVAVNMGFLKLQELIFTDTEKLDVGYCGSILFKRKMMQDGSKYNLVPLNNIFIGGQISCSIPNNFKYNIKQYDEDLDLISIECLDKLTYLYYTLLTGRTFETKKRDEISVALGINYSQNFMKGKCFVDGIQIKSRSGYEHNFSISVHSNFQFWQKKNTTIDLTSLVGYSLFNDVNGGDTRFYCSIGLAFGRKF
jgi:hypothetical protein